MNLQPAIFIMSGAILAALLTGVFSFVNLIVSKEQKVSEFRQNWIDGLREDISCLLANIETLSRLAKFKLKALKQPEFSDKQIYDFRAEHRDLYVALNETKYRILLRINPNEHKNLVICIYSLLSAFLGSCGKEDLEKVFNCQEKITTNSQNVLKREWVRVKKGENAYRRTKTVFIFLLILFVIAIALWGDDAWKIISNMALAADG